MTVLRFLNVPTANIKAINNVPLAVIKRVNNVDMGVSVPVGNDAMGLNFYRTDCVSIYGTYYEPVGVYFGVNAGAFFAPTKAEANALASAYIFANGQAYADANDTCVYNGPPPPPPSTTYYSSEINTYYTKSDCGSGYHGSDVYVNLPYGSYTSEVSQQDADDQATAAAQDYANANGTCILDTPPGYPASIFHTDPIVSGGNVYINQSFYIAGGLYGLATGIGADYGLSGQGLNQSQAGTIYGTGGYGQTILSGITRGTWNVRSYLEIASTGQTIYGDTTTFVVP